MEKYLLVIEADENDGDMIYSYNEISENTLNNILPIIKSIKKCDQSHNFESKYNEYRNKNFNYKTAEELYEDFKHFELFQNLCPRSEFGFHSIEHIGIYNISNFKNLFKRKK